jgi:hypothetical protein
MAAALCEYFDEVWAKDISDYGFGDTSNFLDDVSQPSPDWIITNPPFRLAEQFYHRARQLSRGGVALLVRTVFLESVGRLERLFANHPPTYVAQFAERVPMVKGRLDPKISTATGYAWFVWCGPSNDATKLLWIPACRKSLEQALDYDPAFLDVERLRRRGLNINSRYPGESKSPGSPSIRA